MDKVDGYLCSCEIDWTDGTGICQSCGRKRINMNFQGRWRCSVANVEIEITEECRMFGYQNCAWVGIIKACGLQIFSMWDKKGNHFSDPKLNLTQIIDSELNPPIRK